MTHFCVFRLDRTDGQAAAIRKETLAAHRDYMASFGERVLLGGPVLNEDGTSRGGLMVIEAENEDEVRAILASDPFEIAGLSTTIHVYPFRWQTNRPAHLPPL